MNATKTKPPPEVEIDTAPPIVTIPQAEPSPLTLFGQAIAAGVDPDKLGKLLDLKERMDKTAAIEAYQRAMCACQEEMPAILKDKENLHTKSRYPDLGAIIHKIKPVYTKHGFSLSFHEGETPKPGFLRCLCDVMHTGGHREQKWMDLPIDGKGSQGGNSAMNPLQGVGSTHTYGERYLTCKIFNLPVANTDLDGNNGATIPEEVVDWIEKTLTATNADRGRFLKWCGVEKIEDITAAKWPAIRVDLQRKLAAAKGATS